MSLDLSHLNKEQRQAVETTEKPLLLLAGAGSGKTGVITYRIAHLVENLGVPANRILALTFTNKAAKEMRGRVKSILRSRAKGITLSTFHALCISILRKYIGLLGFHHNFVIFGSDDQLRLVRTICEDLELIDDATKPKDYYFKIMNAKGKGLKPDYFSSQQSNAQERITGLVFREYTKALKNCNAVDFEDILFFTLDILQRFTEETIAIKEQYDYIMVDEYQDTNKVQYQLVQYLTEKSRKLCVVGDDDQSIYEWRGADITNIFNFQKDYPEAVTIALEQNYRSTATILSAANDVISNNGSRMPKKLWTSGDQGSKILWFNEEKEDETIQEIIWKIREYKQFNEISWSDVAFLYRSNFQSRVIEEQLRLERIPYQVVGGTKFFDRKEVQDCLAYLKFVYNPTNEVGLHRIVNYPRRGIGKSSIGILNDARKQDQNLWEVLLNLDEVPKLSKKARASLESFVSLIERTRERLKSEPFPQVFKELFETIDMAGAIQTEVKDKIQSEKKVNNYHELISNLYLYEKDRPGSGLQDFLDYVGLMSDTDGYNEQLPKISLLTIHSAKGLEFDFVVIYGLAEGQIPHQRSIRGEDPEDAEGQEKGLEEERRLFYVAITRARKMLAMGMPNSRMLYGEWKQNYPSRFLEEIKPERFNKPPIIDAPPAQNPHENAQARKEFFNRFNSL